MANNQQNNNQQNINQQQQANQAQQESIQQVRTLLESLKEVLGIRTKLTEFERDTLNTNKKFHRKLTKQCLAKKSDRR